MRISDWSSYVCSSDLPPVEPRRRGRTKRRADEGDREGARAVQPSKLSFSRPDARIHGWAWRRPCHGPLYLVRARMLVRCGRASQGLRQTTIPGFAAAGGVATSARRSEARRGGEEGVSRGNSRGSPSTLKKKKNQ